MQITPEFIMGACAALGTWVSKELFSFLLKRKKLETQSYKPDRDWKKYCTENFEDIKETVHKINTKVEVFDVRISYLEKREKYNGRRNINP